MCIYIYTRVCVYRLNRRKTSITCYNFIYIYAGGHRGPGGSVTNEDTSPGPV